MGGGLWGVGKRGVEWGRREMREGGKKGEVVSRGKIGGGWPKEEGAVHGERGVEGGKGGGGWG